MTMFARDLSVAHYRSFDSYRLALDEGVTILAGPNAAGKTNLIEALQLLTSGVSFRHPTAAELVHDGVGSCKVELRLEGDGRVLDMGLSAEDGKRSFSRNGKRCSAAGVRGVLPSVLFCPDHLVPSQSLTRVLIKIYLHLPTQRQEHLIIPNIWLMRKTEPILWHKNSNSHIPAS